jgi:hypothetical protein
LSLYELSKLWGLRVLHEAVSGDLYKLDMALHRACASKGRWIDKASYIRLLQIRVQVELKMGQHYAAISTFSELVDAAGEKSEEVLALKPAVDKLWDMINGDDILKISAEVRSKDKCYICDNSWGFTPVRNVFSLANITGTLESIEMRCDHRRFESPLSSRLDWQIPAEWGTCHVQIFGEPGTTFDVLMLPSS